jgi:hypothetical protein
MNLLGEAHTCPALEAGVGRWTNEWNVERRIA